MSDDDLPDTVLVLQDGLWHFGWVEAPRQCDSGAWGVSVRYRTDAGTRYLDWVPVERLHHNGHDLRTPAPA